MQLSVQCSAAWGAWAAPAHIAHMQQVLAAGAVAHQIAWAGRHAQPQRLPCLRRAAQAGAGEHHAGGWRERRVRRREVHRLRRLAVLPAGASRQAGGHVKRRQAG